MSDFKLKVFGARAVIRVEKEADVSIGGIILPQTAGKEPTNKGTVMAVGEGIRLDNGITFPMEIALHDEIIFSPMAGAPVKVDGDDNNYIIINERDVLAIITQ
jgi:chaperonin GroES